MNRHIRLVAANDSILTSIKEDNAKSLPGGGGGGSHGGMDGEIDRRFQAIESRLGKVEDKLERAGEHLANLRVDAARIDERVKHLPTKGYINTVVTGALALITALVTLAPKIQAFFGVSH